MGASAEVITFLRSYGCRWLLRDVGGQWKAPHHLSLHLLENARAVLLGAIVEVKGKAGDRDPVLILNFIHQF